VIDYKKIMPVIGGTVIAVILFFVPEMKPLACGGAFALVTGAAS